MTVTDVMQVMFWVDTSLELVKIVRDLRTNDPPVMCCRPLQVGDVADIDNISQLYLQN